MGKKTSNEDRIRLLELLKDHEIKDIANILKISEGTVRGRIRCIREMVVRKQDFINRVRTLQRISPRVRKFTTDGDLHEKTDGLEEF